MTIEEWAKKNYPNLRAVVPAPPVERALNPWWDKRGADESWICTNSRRHGTDAQVTAAYAARARYAGACDACAEAMGVFASPEPKAEAAKCDARCGTRGPMTEDIGDWWTLSTGERFCTHACRARELEKRRVFAPAPVVEKPRPLTCWLCSSSERVAMRITRNAATTCERCYLQQEAKFASLMVEGDKLLADQKPRPAAHPGVTPVVFGLSVGILGARGMR